jgi:hypothetical protein
MTSFEVRTSHNRPALAFDSLERARDFLKKHARPGWKIYRIERTETEIAA